MKTFYLTIALSLIWGSLCSQIAYFEFEEAKSIGSVGEDASYTILTDDQGNIYTCGKFEDTVDFDPGDQVYNLISKGSSDGYIQKLDAYGGFLWAIQIGDTLQDYCWKMTIDESDNVIVSGSYRGQVDFDPGVDESILSTSNQGNPFFMKVDSNGNFVWVKEFVSDTYGGWPGILASDDFDNIYITGGHGGNTDFDPGPNEFIISTNPNNAWYIYLVKLDSNGEFIWAQSYGTNIPTDQMNGIFGQEVYDIELDGEANIYLTGLIVGSFEFYDGISASSVSSNGYWDIFVLKIDTNGDFEWVKQIGDGFVDWAEGIALDNEGNVYVTGSFFENPDFDPGPDVYELNGNYSHTEPFLLKLDNNGNFLWVKEIGEGSCLDCDGAFSGLDVEIDDFGSIYYRGHYATTSDLDPGEEVFTFDYIDSTLYSHANVITKLDSEGNFIWAKDLLAQGYPSNINDFIIGHDGNLYFTGQYMETYDFNPGIPEFNLSSNGELDAFIFIIEQKAPIIPEVPDAIVSMPNVFSPNNDYLNDRFIPIESSDLKDAHISIYNRWGLKLFESDELLKGWNGQFNGKKIPEGVYFWVINYSSYNGNPKQLKGSVTLVR